MKRPSAFLFALGSLALSAGCTSGLPGSPGDPDPDPSGFDRGALVENLADAVILPTYSEFKTKAEGLHAASIAWEAAAALDPSAAQSERGVAQEAWRAAMSTWQRAELMQIGPAASPTEGAGENQGAEALRDEIYSWPSENPCAVDQQLVTNAFQESNFFPARLVTVKGLDALEYVLFTDVEDNACAGAASINTEGTWNALGGLDGVTRRRAEFAVAASAYLVESIDRLLAAWEGPNGYRAKLLLEDDAYFLSSAEALDEVFAGMFYLELMVKDRKLAVPAGLHLDCADEICPDDLESGHADHAVQNLIQNFQAFEALFSGGEGVGFDDYLDAVGASDLKERMQTHLAAATAAFEGLDGSLEDLLVSDRLAVVAHYEAVKLFTDDLKSEFVTVLNLRIPSQGDGDND